MTVRLIFLFSALVMLASSVAPMDLACAFEIPAAHESDHACVESEHEEESDDCCDDESACNFCGVCHPSIAVIQIYSSDLKAIASANFESIESIQSLFDPSGPEEPPRRSSIS